MAAPFIIEAFDEGERRVARLGLCLEPAASEQLALKRGEEALAHGIVVCVADRTHRGAHARVTAAVAELDRAVLITQARITDEIKSAGLDWITALRAPAIKGLLQSGALQLSLFDQRDMASITTSDFPDERLVVCRNPDLAAERSRKREDLLVATERDLARIQAAVVRRRAPLRGAAEIALAVGAVINRHKMAKHSRSTFQARPSTSLARRPRSLPRRRST